MQIIPQIMNPQIVKTLIIELTKNYKKKENVQIVLNKPKILKETQIFWVYFIHIIGK